MGLAATYRILFRLVLALGTAGLAASAGAIPSSPAPLPMANGAVHTAPRDHLSDTARRDTGAEPPPQAISAAAAGQPASAPHGAKPFIPPCLHGAGNEQQPAVDSSPISCAEPVDRQERFSLQIGRRVRAGNGVLGQVDGLLVNYRVGNGVTLNGVAGYAAAATAEPVDLSRQVFGISAGTARFAPAWDLSSYFIEQQRQGRSESRTLGGVLRYLRPKRSLLVSLDYDANESALSTFMISGAWKLLRRTTLSASYDVSRSNGHRGREAFLQQSLAATEGWKWALPVERIRHLTGASSTEVNSLGLGLSHRLSRRLKLNGDVAVLDVSRASASASNEYFYHVKLTADDLVLSGDQSALALHYDVRESSQTSSATLDTKYRINRVWQINPRVRTDYRNDAAKNAVDWTTSPALKMEYRRRQAYGIEIEAGGKWSSRRFPAENKSESSYFLTLGYQASF